MSRFKGIIFMVVFSIQTLFCLGQSGAFLSEKSLTNDLPFSVQTWNSENGLPQNSVTGITQTPDGYLWVSTQNGLVRFDGVHFGYRSMEAKGVEETYKKSRSEGFGPEVQRRFMAGTFVLSNDFYDSYYANTH